jgi:hypothetical protein
MGAIAGGLRDRFRLARDRLPRIDQHLKYRDAGEQVVRAVI